MSNLTKEAMELLNATGIQFGRQNPDRKSGFPCPSCGHEQRMQPYISFLAPVYETYMCNKCGGIFYELVDKSKLDEAIKNAAPHLMSKAIE